MALPTVRHNAVESQAIASGGGFRDSSRYQLVARVSLRQHEWTKAGRNLDYRGRVWGLCSARHIFLNILDRPTLYCIFIVVPDLCLFRSCETNRPSSIGVFEIRPTF
jgi:hypothetical protein